MYQLADPKYEAFRKELVAKDRAQYHPSQHDTLEESYIVKAKCASYTKAFVEKFPELRIERGWVTIENSPFRGSEHWWCVAPDGTIVDPTLNQFSFWNEPHRYTIFDPKVDRIYIGKCCNCGMEIYGLEEEGPAEICPPEEGEEVSECATSYESYLRSEMMRYR